ncbi:MAG: response regulator transcription factor [Acidimicrobiia bacterium]|nr:response regulator transcription factor [Acidimicrobiia bacterium]
MEVIKLLICDDQEVVREGLRAILGTVSGIEVMGVVGNGAEAVEAVAAGSPDVVLMDLNMPIKNGVQATREIVASHPEVKVLVLTTYDAEEWVVDAIRAGAAGYLLKDAPREQLVAAIKGTASGATHVDPAVAGNLFSLVATAGDVANTNVADKLSERELDVLRLLGKGLSNSQIAAQLFLSEGTVRNYVSAVLAKLQVSDRTQAAVLAVKNGLVE